jgi:hypothetical protein
MRNLRSILLWTAFLVLLPLAAFAEDDPAWERWNPWIAREVEPGEDDA